MCKKIVNLFKKANGERMFILDKKFIEKTDYSWFANKLDDNFKIELNNESMVIFGYNGIGKSTIFNFTT